RARGGLGAAIRSLTRHCPMRVQLNVRVPARLPEAVEVVAYYVAAESLANTMKYAKASVVHVDADTPNGNRLRLTVRDDGVGGADPARGTGLLGLIERVEALNGTIKIESPTGEGTVLQVELPIPIHDAEPVG
ncbi:MAG: sensor histidine kinase, partial [Mycobacterium sp.]